MIERNKSRKRKPRTNHRRGSGIKLFNNNQHNNVPKSRGGISKALEKYTSLAQDAQSNGDRIVAENFYQYAEHYQRLLNELGFDSQNSTNTNLKNQDENVKTEKFSSVKPSRTQRAISAKNDRLSSDKEVVSSSDKKANKQESFTSDGIEALKPFEASLSEEKTQSS